MRYGARMSTATIEREEHAAGLADAQQLLHSVFGFPAFRPGQADIIGTMFDPSVTFDDGYTDNLTTASPILRRAGIPATFFICTGCLGDVRGFWWDRVATAIAAADIAARAFELTPYSA